MMYAYEFDVKTMTESFCVAKSMKMYRKKVAELETSKKKN